MQIQTVLRILGILLITFSFSMLVPAGIAWYYDEPNKWLFIDGFAIIVILGLIIWFPNRGIKQELRTRDGFIIVVMFWTVLGLSGSVPLYLCDMEECQIEISLTDAVFESMSALTTTGATVLTNLDYLPPSILFYRQELQWLGGMGIIVLAVAILPMLGVGGMQLYRAETPGPIKDSKLTPRITETAKTLWYIYVILTVACAVSYKLAGMNWFDAIGHSFSTVAIGGFSTHDASLGYFSANPMVEIVAMIFMFLAGINFALHFSAWRHLTSTPHAVFSVYYRDSEFKVYFFLLLGLSIITSLSLYFLETYGDNFGEAVRNGFFHVISVATTTGFSTDNFSQWPGAIPVLLIFASFLGGCAGSTGGGMKIIRFLLILKQGVREINRLIHPNAKLVVKVNRKTLPENIIEAVWGFFSVYIVIFIVFMLLFMSLGLDQVTAFSAVAATLNNLGPGLGEVASNFQTQPDAVKWLSCLAMLMGRLEIFTLLVILSPAFWRR